MAALDNKYHIKIGGYGFMLSRQQRTQRHIYGREEAPAFVNKFSSGDPNYRDSTFFPHWVQNNWLNGFDQEKFNDGGKFYRSSQIDTTEEEELVLEKAIASAGTITGQVKSFGLRSSSAQGWWNTNYAYRQQLTISANATQAAPAGHPIKVTIDTAALETATKLRSDRKDWRIVYSNGTTLTDLSRDYIDATTTFFALQAQIPAGQTDSNYYIYYGYASESTTKQPSTEAEWNAVYGMFGTTPDANTMAVYHLREGSGSSVNDDSSNTRNATTEGSPAWGTDGKFGRYLTFTNDTAKRINAGDIDIGSFTVEGWFYLTSLAQASYIFSKAFDSLGATTVNARIHTDGKVYLTTDDGGGGGATISGGSISINTWYHIAVTWDGTTAKIFVEATQVATGSGTTPVGSSQPLYIAVNKESPFLNAFTGRMQQLRISDIARTSFPYVLTTEPSYVSGGEITQAAVSASGTFEVYAGTTDGEVYLWDGNATWTSVFNIRRLVWFDTVANNDTDLIVGDTGGTETAQSQGFQLATASKIKGIQVYLKKNAGTPGDITVRIETDSTNKPSGTLADANLTATIPAFTTATYGWITVEFTAASSATLNSGTTFHVVLKTAAASNDNNYAWAADGSSPSYSGGASSHSTDGGSTWSADTAKDCLFRILGENSQVNQFAQVTFSGSAKLWLATGDPANTNNNNARVYTYDGTSWVIAKTFTGTGSAAALCLQVYNSALYIGFSPTAMIQVTTDGTTFTSSKDIDEPNNPGYVWDMEVYNGRLYAAGGNPEYVLSSNTQGFLWSYDGFSWTFVYNFDFTVIKSLGVFDSLLFLGSIDSKLFVYNTASMDKLQDFPWDVSINSLVVFDDKLAVGLGATNSLTGEEAIYIFDRNGFHKAYVPTSAGVNAMITARNQLLIGCTSTTIYKVLPTTYVDSGTLQMSYFEASLPSIDKLWRSLILHHKALPSGCSILIEYKTDESDASWTTLGTSNTVDSTIKELTFPVGFYSKKISLRATLSTTDTSHTPTLKVVDLKYVTIPDFKYMWKMKLVCADQLIWLDGTEPISTTAEAITADETDLDLADAGGFPTQGRAVVVDNDVEDEFTWTGKTGNTLTGCVGLAAHSSTGLVVKITGAMLHKQILVMKQTKQLYTFTDIDGLEYTVHFHQYQADGFTVNQDEGIENDVPITLLEA